MAFMGWATDKRTGDSYQLYLGLNYAVPVNAFWMDGDGLPNSFTVKNVPTLVLPLYKPDKKFIQATWLYSELYLTKERSLSMGDFAHNTTRATNGAVETVEARIDPCQEYDVLAYQEDGTPKLGIKPVSERNWQHNRGAKPFSVEVQIYQLAPILLAQ